MIIRFLLQENAKADDIHRKFQAHFMMTLLVFESSDADVSS
jgi:hypothetical protein